MPARLSRKRYTEIVRYLKAVVADETKADRLRMTATQSLLEVYARHDRTEQQKEGRKRAREGTQDAAQPTEAPEGAEERAEQFLARIRAERNNQ
jgi:hypothetical protein